MQAGTYREVLIHNIFMRTKLNQFTLVSRSDHMFFYLNKITKLKFRAHKSSAYTKTLKHFLSFTFY